MAWTTDDLVSEVRLKAWLPTADDLSPTDILSFANDELQVLVAATLKTGQEEHWVTREDVSITSSRVRLPRRALARAMRAITVLDPSGTEGRFDLLPAGEAWSRGSGTAPTVGYVEGEELVFLGTPAAGWKVRFRYLARPSRLVPVASCAAISSALSTTTIKVTTPPAELTTVNALVDIVRGDEPFGLSYIDRDVKTWSDPNLTFQDSTPVEVAAIAAPTGPGTRVDYLCPRDCTCYPPIPFALWPLLVASTATAIHEAQANRVQAASSGARAGRQTQAARGLFEPRVQTGGPSVIQRRGPLRGGR